MTCRKHRVDSNIIVTTNEQKFMEDIPEFISQIANEEYLNLFITSLSVEKTNEICDSLAAQISKVGKYFTSHLTALAKQTPQKIEDALKLIKFSDNVEDGIGYLIFLTNSSALYNTALGMYDFGLCVAIAQQCQMDPKEYIPDLEALKKLQEDIMKFRIDERLGRKEKAIGHIAETNFALFCEYIVKWELYSVALLLVPESTENWKNICALYAEYLSLNEDYNLGGIMFLRSESYKDALDCFIKSGDWKMALSVCRTKLPSKITRTCEELEEVLKTSGKYEDLADLYFESGDYESAVWYLTEAAKWNRAYMSISKYSLKQSLFNDAAKAGSERLLNEMKKMKATFQTHSKRLAYLHENHDGANIDGIEMMSDTASMATTLISSSLRSSRTGNTARTGKQRRKMARKRAMGKGGFEDEFLLLEINKLRITVANLQNEINELTKILLLIDFAVAKEIQLSFKGLWDLVANESVFSLQKELSAGEEESRKKIIPAAMVSADWKCAVFQ